MKLSRAENLYSSVYPCARVEVLYARIEELPFGGGREQLMEYAFWDARVFVKPIVVKQDS